MIGSGNIVKLTRRKVIGFLGSSRLSQFQTTLKASRNAVKLSQPTLKTLFFYRNTMHGERLTKHSKPYTIRGDRPFWVPMAIQYTVIGSQNTIKVTRSPVIDLFVVFLSQFQHSLKASENTNTLHHMFYLQHNLLETRRTCNSF
jgi:hypothetical protein